MICTYNPDIEHLKYAINSALLQNNVSLQIVITDDCSKDFAAEQIIDYFEEKGFHDFTICRLPDNKGTVKNFRYGLSYCKGTFVRGLSPEDYIYGRDTLRKWIDFTLEHNAVVSFSNVICYRFENEDIIPVKRKANPQTISNYYKGCWGYNYLVFNDICVGAGMLVKKDTIDCYTRLLEDNHVIYAEDNSYRLMAMRRESMVYYDQPTALYEVGNGMSTSNSDVWRKRLSKDWDHTDEIMLEWARNMNENDFLKKYFKRIVEARYITNRLHRKISHLLVPGYLMYWIKEHISPRFTCIDIDRNYLEELKRY